jgi:predicted dienelactone hydrolase
MFAQQACDGPAVDEATGMLSPSLRPLAAFACVLSFIFPDLGGTEIPAIAPGPFAVATTNLEVQPQAAAKTMFNYLNGMTTAEGTRYLTDILLHPAAVPTVQLDVPADARLYGPLAGKRLPLVLLIVYPTTRDNARADYVFPYTETGDRTFTHMQQPGYQPLPADPGAKHPVIVMSGGYNTHGLWHLYHLKQLASHGYMVVDIFHGDGRSDLFAGNLALRGLGVRATLDYLEQHPDFGPMIDPDRIGATGESAGAHTVLAALGGTDPSGRLPALPDPRVKAAFGVVPFMGGSFGFWPFKVDAWYFGEDHAGLRSVRRPFFAVYGGKDTNVPPAGVEAGARAMSGPSTTVMLPDEAHLLTDTARLDIHTWEILFFNCWLRNDKTARQQLAQGTTVHGGVSDRVTHRQNSTAQAP